MAVVHRWDCYRMSCDRNRVGRIDVPVRLSWILSRGYDSEFVHDSWYEHLTILEYIYCRERSPVALSWLLNSAGRICPLLIFKNRRDSQELLFLGKYCSVENLFREVLLPPFAPPCPRSRAHSACDAPVLPVQKFQNLEKTALEKTFFFRDTAPFTPALPPRGRGRKRCP